MKYLVVAGPAYGKTSLVKGLNKLSGELIAADLDCKGLKPPYANEGILTRCVCDIFDCGYSVVTVHPSACDYDDVIRHCHGRGEDIRVIFAVDNWSYMLTYPLSRIGHRDGFDSNFFHHMLNNYYSIMRELLDTARDTLDWWGEEVVSVVRMDGSVLTEYFGWSETTRRVCFGAPQHLYLTQDWQFGYNEKDYTTEDAAINLGVCFICANAEVAPLTKQLLLLCCRSGGFKSAFAKARHLTCFVYRMSSHTEDTCDEETSFLISKDMGKCTLNWYLSPDSYGTNSLLARLYLPDELIALMAEDTGLSFEDIPLL